MTAATTVSGDVQATKTRTQIVARETSAGIRAGAERRERVEDCRFVDFGLARAKSLGRVGEDANEILFRSGTENDAPSLAGHFRSDADARAAAPTFLR